MASPVQSAELILDLGRYTLALGDRNLRLEKQPMELLILLVEKRGQLVTRDEIVDRLWGKDVFLDTERSINTAIRKIRLALHDDPENPRIIETVVGKGYRFIAPITVIPTQPAALPDDGPHPRRLPRQWRWAPVVAFLVFVAAAGLLLGWHRQWLHGASRDKPIRSIAVLPLQNLSGDASQDYFAESMTEALITDIAKISGLRVISHTSVMHYKGSGKTVPQIARELKVDAVIEGSVARSGGRVRITAQLVEAPTDRHLWAEAYERSTNDVLLLQDEVARAITRQVRSAISPQAQTASLHAQDPEAQDAYARGVHETDTFTREGLNRSVAYFEEAVRKDPQFAQAWAGLAHAYSLLSLFHYAPQATASAKAEAAAARSLELDNSLSEAHAAMGDVLMHKRGAWAASEKELRRGIELNPSNAVAHQSLGYLLAGVLRRFDEGIAEMNRALDLDPLSPSKRNAVGAALFWARRYDDALRVFREIPDGDANTERRHRRMAEIYDRKGMQQESVEELQRALELTGRQALAAAVKRAYRGDGYAAARKTFFLGDIRERKLQAQRANSEYDLWLAADYAMLNDKDEAFHWLDRASADREGGLAYAETEPHFDNLRSDPRFAAFLRREGLN